MEAHVITEVASAILAVTRVKTTTWMLLVTEEARAGNRTLKAYTWVNNVSTFKTRGRTIEPRLFNCIHSLELNRGRIEFSPLSLQFKLKTFIGCGTSLYSRSKTFYPVLVKIKFKLVSHCGRKI